MPKKNEEILEKRRGYVGAYLDVLKHKTRGISHLSEKLFLSEDTVRRDYNEYKKVKNNY